MRQSDDRVPEVAVAEAAPAGLAGANTGRSPRLKPYRRCRSGSVSAHRRVTHRPLARQKLSRRDAIFFDASSGW